MMADHDRARAKRAADAMMKMVKIDIAALQAAYGTPGGAAGSLSPVSDERLRSRSTRFAP
jgi:hypothetical protein